MASRIRIVEPGVILMRELPHSSAATYRVFIATALELAKPYKRFARVNDIREVGNRPRGEYYDAIVETATTLGVHWAIVMLGGALVRTIARFIMARVLKAGKDMGITWSLHDNVDAAVSHPHDALAKAGGP